MDIKEFGKKIAFGAGAVGAGAALWSGIMYGVWLGQSYADNGVHQLANGTVKIGKLNSPFRFVEYTSEPNPYYPNLTRQSIHITRPFSFHSEFLSDWDNDDLVDSLIGGDDFQSIRRSDKGTEELFQRADKAWSEYTTFLNVEEILVQPRELQDYSEDFNF